MTGMICVLTGDIVGSTQLGRGKLDQLTNTIRSIASFSLSLGACGKASARSL